MSEKPEGKIATVENKKMEKRKSEKLKKYEE